MSKIKSVDCWGVCVCPCVELSRCDGTGAGSVQRVVVFVGVCRSYGSRAGVDHSSNLVLYVEVVLFVVLLLGVTVVVWLVSAVPAFLVDATAVVVVGVVVVVGGVGMFVGVGMD